jgi:hypothetical protein
MTLSSINDSFIFHRKTCKLCASDGVGLCWVGMKLMRLFHDVLVEEIAKETRELKGMRVA